MASEELPKQINNLWLYPALISLAIIVIITASFWNYTRAPANTKTAEIYIQTGATFKQIEQQLVDSGAIKSDIRFAIIARMMGVAHKLQAGEYHFEAQVSPKDILQIMLQGQTVNRSLTIAEGLNIYQIAEVFKVQDITGAADFLSLASDPVFLERLEIPASTIEGYIFPDTYFFAKGEPLVAIVTRMVKRMAEVLREERAKLIGKDAPPTAHNLSPHQILTLASIVEKETGIAAERPLVAEVFLNRLRKKMRLQADPTVTYGLSKFDTPLSRKDLKTPSPYNTYTNKGLPIGPICSPGRDSIAAVLHPASSGYYYFVADNDGGHIFSKKLAEHNRAVVQYRRKKIQKND